MIQAHGLSQRLELEQGRFSVRVELKSLSVEDFIDILKEPKNALVKQYTALLETKGIKPSFTDDALEKVAHRPDPRARSGSGEP